VGVNVFVMWWYLIAAKVQSLTKTNEDLLEIFMTDATNMNACTDGVNASVFTVHGTKIGEKD
jgi:hypothetical protein